MKRSEIIERDPPAISYLIERRLLERSVAKSGNPELHPDEDTIAAFVEARLVEAEYLPVVSHLIDCGVCRQTTAQLVRLEFDLDETDEATPSAAHESRLSSLLSGLASHLVPATEDTVFAYQNPESAEPESPAKPEADSEVTEDNDKE